MLKASARGLFAKLGKTRQSLSDGLSSLFGGKERLTDEDYEDLEDQLILSDMGAAASARIVESLRRSVSRERLDAGALRGKMRAALAEILAPVACELPGAAGAGPLVIFMVGVNGVGKTTTCAKLAHYYKSSGQSVMLAACDTFRAAAIEQLQRWGERIGVPVVAQKHGSDAAAVAHDAMQSAQARGIDVLIIDSAGRQHVNADLMEQLAKVVRVISRLDASAPHEIWLTVDAGNGQNVLSQIENFSRTVALSGLCVTKLDGTARGGVLVAVAEQFGLKVPFIGVGEGLDDLRRFDAESFAAALLGDAD